MQRLAVHSYASAYDRQRLCAQHVYASIEDKACAWAQPPGLFCTLSLPHVRQ
jgi:hypothetical protein